MTDDLATRATLMVTIGIFACVGLAFGTTALWQWLRGPAGRHERPGWVLGLALWSAGMLWVVWDGLADAWQRRGHTVVQGRLIGFESEVLRESARGTKLRGNAPVVEFRGADGRLHRLRALAGSQQGRQPGDAVEVRVHPADPQQSKVEDFQNQYAALWLFGTLALVTSLGALHGLIDAATGSWRDPSMPQRPQPATAFERWRDGPGGVARHRFFKRLAVATAALAVGGIFFITEVVDVAQAFAITLAGLAGAMVHLAIAAALEPGKGRLLSAFGYLIGAVGFAGFAGLLWGLVTR